MRLNAHFQSSYLKLEARAAEIRCTEWQITVTFRPNEWFHVLFIAECVFASANPTITKAMEFRLASI